MTPAEARAAVRAVVEAASPVWIDPPIVQPGALYLELLGEDVRRRALMLQDEDGADLCLRPDMTVPALRVALAQTPPPPPPLIAYDGLVFRKQASGSAREREFVQVGAEWIGRAWPAAQTPETEVVARALEGCRAAGVEPALTLGDASLVGAFVRACGVGAPWDARVLRALARPDGLRALRDALAAPVREDPMAAAIASLPQENAERVLTEMLRLGGVSLVGARSAGEIADRVRAKYFTDGETKPSAAALELLSALVAINAPLAEGVASMERLLDNPALTKREEARQAAASVAAHLAALGEQVDLPARTHFAPGLMRGVGYYDGLVFELEAASLGERASLGGGGRYDALVRRLGGEPDLCAAGFVLRPQRLAEAAS